MAKIEHDSSVGNEIEHLLEYHIVVEEHRDYLGYSEIGHPCLRYLYYSFYWSFKKQMTQRIRRLMNRGKQEELVLKKEMVNVGIPIFNDQEEITGFAGHIKGHTDGCFIFGVTKNLLELKTMNKSNFAKYKKEGLKKFSKKYWYQVHAYMGKLELERCLYVVTNKDNDERDYQWIDFDEKVFEQIEILSEELILNESLPDKIGSKTWFECKFCNARDICHNKATPEENCRTCQYFDVLEEGKFSCSFLENKNVINYLTTETQRVGCKAYTLSEVLK